MDTKYLGIFGDSAPGIAIVNTRDYLDCMLIDFNSDNSEICHVKYQITKTDRDDDDSINETIVRNTLRNLTSMIRYNLGNQIDRIID